MSTVAFPMSLTEMMFREFLPTPEPPLDSIVTVI